MNMQIVANAFRVLERTTGRIRMTETLGSLFRETPQENLDQLIYLCQGRLGPAFEKIEFGVSEKLITRALAEATGRTEQEITRDYKKKGDLGTVAEELLHGRGEEVSLGETYAVLKEVAVASGGGSVARKVELLANLLRRLSGLEARYVLRIVQGRLRLGVGDATILDALSYAAAGDSSLRPPLERAYNLCSDLGLVGKVLFAAGVKGLEALTPQVGKPVRPALAERLPSAEEIIRRLTRVGAEPKYDGLRLQVHKDDGAVKVFSRRLEDLTEMFPEVTQATIEQVKARRAIFEGEAVVFQPETGEYRPFQITVQRKRKYGIEEMSARYPLRLFTFDLLYVDSEDLTPRPLRERRARLEAVLPFTTDSTLAIAEQLETSNATELESFFLAMIEHGLEGVVAKRLDAAYHAGARNFNWVKLKRAYQEKLRDTVDVVLVGYLVGRGHRARFGIGSLLGAVYDRKEDRFSTVAKVGSGLTEEQWTEIKHMLDEAAVDHCPARVDSLLVPDVWVEPTYVVEVQADEITRSPVHTAGKLGNEPGYALRFPRMIDWIREDKAPEDATTVDEILEMYRMQTQH